MSQQPPEWWSRQRGSRFGCADVTIVSIASIVAFLILIFVLLRPDFVRVLDVTGGSGNATVSVNRATETPASSGVTPVATFVPTPTTTALPPAPTITPAPSITPRRASLKDSDGCRLRQDAGYDASVIQVFGKGTNFKIYSEQKVVGKDTWLKVEPDDNSNRVGWMLSDCF
jgi:hypothetical protein